MATQALTTRENTAVAAQSNNPVVKFRGQLEQRANEFKMVLPSHIKPEQFQRTILTAVQADPELLNADRQSLILACMKAAQDGLLPDKREAALVVYKENKNVNGQWIEKKVVQYLSMVYGLRKKILQSREVTDIKASVVYRREALDGHFIYEEGTEAVLRHKPILDLSEEEAADSQIVAAYSMATYKDGTKSYEVMRRFEVDKVRESSQTGATKDKKGRPRTPKGPWVDWYPEQAKKTVIRRHSKTLPQSGDIIAPIDVEERDDALYAASTGSLLDVEPDAPRLVPPTREEQAVAEGADPDTGELPSGDDEDAARAADAEAQSYREGRSDPDMGEGNNDTLADHPFRAVADKLIERAGKVELLADLGKVEADLAKDREAAPEELAAEVEAAIAAAKARFGKGKS